MKITSQIIWLPAQGSNQEPADQPNDARGGAFSLHVNSLRNSGLVYFGRLTARQQDLVTRYMQLMDQIPEARLVAQRLPLALCRPGARDFHNARSRISV